MSYNAHYKLAKTGKSFAVENAVYGEAQLTLGTVRVLEILTKTAVSQSQSSTAIMRALHEENCLMSRYGVQSRCHSLIILGLAAWCDSGGTSKVAATPEASRIFYSARQDIKDFGALKAYKALNS